MSAAGRDPLTARPVAPARPRVGYGCSLAGAYNVVGQIGDAATVMHGDAGCAHLSLATHIGTDLRGRFDRAGAERSVGAASRLLTTDLRERDVVFGAESRLRRAIVEADRRLAPAAIFVISACVAELIGEDVAAVATEVQPEVRARVVPLVSGGVCSGSFASGATSAYQALVDEFVAAGSVEPLTVNILAEKNLYVAEDREYAEIARLLDLLGVRVKCRFVRGANVSHLRGVGRAALNLPRERENGVPLAQLLERHCGTPWLDAGYPSSRSATVAWLGNVAAALGVAASVRADALKAVEARYAAGLAGARETTAGKRVVVNAGGDPRWAVELAQDAGLVVVKVNLLGTTDPAIAREVASFGLPVASEVAPADAIAETRELAPDLALFPYGLAPTLRRGAVRCLTSVPPAGLSVLDELATWARLATRPEPEGWRR